MTNGWGEAEATALIGVAAAYAWHHLSRRRGIVARWQQMHVGDRLPIVRLGERLHGLHFLDALSAALHLRRDVPATRPVDHPRRVLIVDDDADLRGAMADILAAEGMTVLEAADGYEGLRRAREERPDLILLDLAMPRMDGFGFRAQQRADAALASIPVVVVSASDSPQVNEFGAAGYLHKPFDLRVLLEALDRHAAVPA